MLQPLWFTDESSKVGSGVRMVRVKTRGRKWTHLEYFPGGREGHKVNVKLKKSLFELMERDTEKQVGSWHPFYNQTNGKEDADDGWNELEGLLS